MRPESTCNVFPSKEARVKRLAMVVSLTALLSGAALFSASPAHASFPCEYGDEGGPSYDLGPGCDSAYETTVGVVDDTQAYVEVVAAETVALAKDVGQAVCDLAARICTID